MHNADLPAISSSNYASTAYGIGAAGISPLVASTISLEENNAAVVQQWLHKGPLINQWKQSDSDFNPKSTPKTKPQEKPQVTTPARRLVQVFIADPDENIPLDQCLLYSGEQKLTDATDQELFFEIDIKGILEKHNAKRTKLVNKKVKERVEHLEAAKVRDLKMVVVTVAQF